MLEKIVLGLYCVPMSKLIITGKDKKKLLGIISKIHPSSCEVLLHKLEAATIVDPKDIPCDVITMNSQIKYLVRERKSEESAKLVYHFDVDKEDGNVSVLSSFGTLLLGMKVGQEAFFSEPDEDSFTIKILEILFQPEANGDWYL